MIIYLTGGESHWKLMLECGVRNQLYSFFHMRTMRAKAFTEMVEALQEEKDRRDEAGEPQLRLFLDSGASTYVANKGKKPDSHTYFREYKECLARTKELWHCVSEVYLDDSKLFDLNQAYAWREELLSLHSQVLPVWHPGRGQTSWDSYCLDPRYSYIAFGAGLDVGTKDRLCHLARLAGKQVHAMSETKLRTDMMYLQADSYSSALWLTAQRYGSMYVFHGNQLRLIDNKNKQERKLFKPYFQASGIDFAQVMADDPYALNKCSLTAWRNMATTLELQGVRNGKGTEAGDNATATGRGRSADEAWPRNGTANTTSKPHVDQRTAKLQGTGVNRSDSVQGSSSTGAKRSFGLHRVYGESENAQGVNHAKYDDKEIDSVGQGREQVVGGGDQRINIQNSAISATVRSPNDRPSVTSGTKIIWEDGRYSRVSGKILDASPMKTRWILDRKLGCLVSKQDIEEFKMGRRAGKTDSTFESLTGVKLLHTQEDYDSDKVSTETGGQSTQAQRSKEKDAPVRPMAGVQGREETVETPVGGKTTVQLGASLTSVEPGSGRNHLGSSDLMAPGQAVGPDIVNYPQDIEDDVNTLSANMPKTVCDNCAISGECKEYSPGAVCYFDDDFGKLPIRNLDANLAEREVLLKFDRTRLMRAIMAERVSGGGALDSRVSQAMDDYIRRKNDFVTLAHKRNTTAVTASLTARGKPGIFSQLLGGAMPTGLRQEGDTEIPLNEPEQANGDVEITMTVTKDVPNKK